MYPPPPQNKAPVAPKKDKPLPKLPPVQTPAAPIDEGTKCTSYIVHLVYFTVSEHSYVVCTCTYCRLTHVPMQYSCDTRHWTVHVVYMYFMHVYYTCTPTRVHYHYIIHVHVHMYTQSSHNGDFSFWNQAAELSTVTWCVLFQIRTSFLIRSKSRSESTRDVFAAQRPTNWHMYM